MGGCVAGLCCPPIAGSTGDPQLVHGVIGATWAADPLLWTSATYWHSWSVPTRAYEGVATWADVDPARHCRGSPHVPTAAPPTTSRRHATGPSTTSVCSMPRSTLRFEIHRRLQQHVLGIRMPPCWKARGHCAG